MIEGVRVKKLKVIPDDRGWLMEILRNDETGLFSEFGQVYLSATYPGVVKAWHYHKKQEDHFCCVQGTVKLVLADTRDDSPTKGDIDEYVIGVHNPMLVVVPKDVYHGWKCLGSEPSLVINIPDKAYDYRDPDEFRIPAHNNGVFEYDWKTVDR